MHVCVRVRVSSKALLRCKGEGCGSLGAFEVNDDVPKIAAAKVCTRILKHIATTTGTVAHKNTLLAIVKLLERYVRAARWEKFATDVSLLEMCVETDVLLEKFKDLGPTRRRGWRRTRIAMRVQVSCVPWMR